MPATPPVNRSPNRSECDVFLAVPLELAFCKMQGAGTDFVVLDRMLCPGETNWGALSRRLCDRRESVGADGLLVLLPSSKAEVRMRMFNPDGSEDDCGNGLRCVALLAARRGYTRGATVTVETLTAVQHTEVDAARGRIRVVMKPARLTPAAVPVLLPGDRILDHPLRVDGGDYRISCAFTGSTHTVLFHHPTDGEFQRVSPILERHDRFPQRTSVLWASVASRERVQVRVWERGAGETLACGTGAAAVAVLSSITGRTDPSVDVESVGGLLHVEVDLDTLTPILTGPARVVFSGAVSVPDFVEAGD